MDRLSTKEAAQYLGLAENTLANWRSTGIGPRFMRIGGGGRIFYKRTDLDTYLQSCVVETKDTRGRAA